MMKKVCCLALGLLLMLSTAICLTGCDNAKVVEGTYYSVSVDGGTGAGKYQEGFACTVKANIPSGKQFLKWIKNGEECSTNAEFVFTVKENSRLIAVFGDSAANVGQDVFVVKTVNGIGDGGYLKGSDCTLKVMASDEARTFRGWVPIVDGVKGEIASTNKVFTFKVTANVLYEATFSDLLLPMPDNSDNKMFNLNAGVGTIEYDRQLNEETNETYTAFVEGVAYIKILVYISDEDNALPIAEFKMVQNADGSGYLASMDESLKMAMSGTPGNYYTPDGNTHNMIKTIIGKGTNGAYDANIAYYFATQAIGIDTAEGEMQYVDSKISGKGRGVVNM